MTSGGVVDSLRYERLGGTVPVFHAPESEERAREVRSHLETGVAALEEVFCVEAPELRALVLPDDDREHAPREGERPYPPGLPYFTRSTGPPTLVMPERLSPAIQPCTGATLPLAVWHELAHAFLLKSPVVKTPPWLREFIPQASSAAVARRERLPLDEHLKRIEEGAGVRASGGAASAEEQMSFQNALLALGAAALERFGEDFLSRLTRELWGETDVVDQERAEALLVGALGDGAWLRRREDFDLLVKRGGRP